MNQILSFDAAPAKVDVFSAIEAERTYLVNAWGSDYFFINAVGHAAVRPLYGNDLSIDLYEVVEALKETGIRFPVLLRFQDLLQTRVVQLNETFRNAIRQARYENVYEGVYPIKVNQLREVVEEIIEAGRPYRYGLECGSKAELAATLPYLKPDDMLLVCNGCKDETMMRMMLTGQKIGKNIIPVLERYSEFELITQLADELNVDTSFGVRVRLSASGAGLWSESGGENSKFGVSLTELLRLIDRLKSSGQLNRFKLLHFHLGSQIASLDSVRLALREAARLYAELYKKGLGVKYVDIGGGLGVSYEAGNPDVPGHIDYTLDEYALAVVQTLKDVCDREGVPHPVIVSESGRAITAYHSVLITEVVDTRKKDVALEPDGASNFYLFQELQAVWARCNDLGPHAGVSTWSEIHRISSGLKGQVEDLFRDGTLSIEQKAQVERLYWSIHYRVDEALRSVDVQNYPDAMADLEPQLLDHYLCNFSVFRSMADYWAIHQRFPIMPIHRLDEKPTRRGQLVDLTCDSDGQVKDFVASTGHKHFLELHPLKDNEPYFLGVFLMGAYQDIMGDQHNLFGRVAEVHIYADADEPGHFYIEKIIPGATVEEQLAGVQYFPNDLERRMESLIQEKVRAGKLRPREGVQLLEHYQHVFRETTYLRPTPER